MKVRYWTLLVAAVVAVTLVAGPAWGQPTCVVISPTDATAGSEVTLTAFDAQDVEFDLSTLEVFESNFHPDAGGLLFIPGEDILDNMAFDGGSVVFTLTADMLGAEVWDFFTVPGGDDTAFRIAGDDAEADTVAEAIAAGGTCEAAPEEALLVFISGPHLVTEGQEVTLVGNVVGGEGTDCGWTKDSGAIGDPGDMELDLGEVSGADEGTYVFECTVDDAPAPSEEFELMLVDAVPLAGGLGLGLLAGACALAGAVSIRRRK